MLSMVLPNIALQRTPLARPLTWARSFGRRGVPALVPVGGGRQRRR